MKRSTIIVLGALTFASSFASHAALAADAPAPPDFPVGDWNCTGNLMPMGNKPGHATSGRARSEKTLDGAWIVVHYDEERTAANNEPYHVAQYFAYDGAKKRFVSVTLDNTGAGYGVGTSPGWKNNSLTIDESTPMAAKQMAYRDTFTRNDAGDLTHTGTMQDKDKKWVKTDEETCHKS